VIHVMGVLVHVLGVYWSLCHVRLALVKVVDVLVCVFAVRGAFPSTSLHCPETHLFTFCVRV
jgi:hypothetical protein